MSISTGIYSWFFKKRHEQILYFKEHPIEVQEEILKILLLTAEETAFGKEHRFDQIANHTDFANQIPIRDYDRFNVYIERILKGEPDVIWPGATKWFAKSSGTTGSRSKFIPLSPDCIENCHFQGGKDTFGMFLHAKPDSKILDGRSLVLGGSHQINQLNEHSYYGDLSAVLTQNLPIWAELLRTPDLKTALNPNYEEKIEMMARKTIDKNITNIVGVPTWTVVLFNRILELTGKDHITEVWPNLELYVHGGVSFEPYREMFKKFIPSESMTYMETYNASEGFFGFQDDPHDFALLLMLDYGIYYEFIAMEDFDKENPTTVQLQNVQLNKNYAIVISTNTGLWRYKIGDTIKFTSVFPFKIKVTGRTKHFINAFGEEVIIENAEMAIAKACALNNCLVRDFTAAPVYFGSNTAGAHQWLIEFENEPLDLEAFVGDFDAELMQLNSDYEAKRKGNMVLMKPQVRALPQGTFYRWLKTKGKLGGQNKIPRLSNDRLVMDDILLFLDNK